MATPARPSPDEEAMLLMMKVLERAQVAKSFARLAAGLLTVGAARATVQLREGPLKSRLDNVRKIARAATAAAVHVAKHRPEAAAAEESPESGEQSRDTFSATGT